MAPQPKTALGPRVAIEEQFSLPPAYGRVEIAGGVRQSRRTKGLRQFGGDRQGNFFPCRGSRQGNGREADGVLRYKHIQYHN
jgi:hypothetical protein